MSRIVAGLALLVVVRFWASTLDSVVGQSEAYLQIAGILIVVIFAGSLVGRGVELRKSKRLAGRNGRILLTPAESTEAKPV